MERKKALRAHMRVVEYIAYAMVPNKKRGKFDAKNNKCLLCGYYKNTKLYKPMYI